MKQKILRRKLVYALVTFNRIVICYAGHMELYSRSFSVFLETNPIGC